MAREDTRKPTKRENKQAHLPEKWSPRFLQDCDARLSIVRQIRSRMDVLKAACGGDESPQRELLASRIAFLSILIETQEVLAAEKGQLDVGSYVQAVNSLTGLLKTIGLDRRVKNVTDLKTYLDERERKAG